MGGKVNIGFAQGPINTIQRFKWYGNFLWESPSKTKLSALQWFGNVLKHFLPPWNFWTFLTIVNNITIAGWVTLLHCAVGFASSVEDFAEFYKVNGPTEICEDPDLKEKHNCGDKVTQSLQVQTRLLHNLISAGLRILVDVRATVTMTHIRIWILEEE